MHPMTTLSLRSLFLLALCLPVALLAEQPLHHGAPASSEESLKQRQNQAELVRLEVALADAEQNHDSACLQQTFADDLIFVAYNGLPISKQSLLDGLSQLKISGYKMRNFKLKQLGQDNALLTYDLEVKGSIMGSDLPSKSYATSIWQNRGDRWQLVYHAETPQKHSLLSKLLF